MSVMATVTMCGRVLRTVSWGKEIVLDKLINLLLYIKGSERVEKNKNNM